MPHNVKHASTLGWTLLLVAFSIGLYVFSSLAMFAGTFILPVLGVLAANSNAPNTSLSSSSADWYAPNQTQVNHLNTVVNSTGVYGFIFNNSYTPTGNDYYGGYNWCNMPHVKAQTYVKAPEAYVLEYVEVVRVDEFSSPVSYSYITGSPPPQTHPLRIERLPTRILPLGLQRRGSFLLWQKSQSTW